MNSAKPDQERWIGEGAYGQVYEIVGQSSVVKYMNRTTENELIRFRKESGILKELAHPNIVKFIRSKENLEERKFGIVMEYCEGGTLKDVIFEPTIIYSMKTVICWAEQLFDALSYMFQQYKVIHRDIKPDNIFVTKDFNLKIGDFGFVKLSENTCSGSFAGTLIYMSPPQIIKENPIVNLQDSHRNDVYSLGLVLWEIIERRRFFSPYRIGTAFDRDWFIMEIVSERITELEPPKCQKELQEIIVEKWVQETETILQKKRETHRVCVPKRAEFGFQWAISSLSSIIRSRISEKRSLNSLNIYRCSNFNRESRSMADEILKSIREFKEKHLTGGKLEFPPIRKVEQPELIRPIGFNGKMDWIGVGDTGFGVDREEFTQSISTRERIFINVDYDSRIQRNLLESWRNLSESEKNSFLQIIPKIVEKEKEKKYSFEKHLEINHLIEEACSNLSPAYSLEEFQKLFEFLILNDYYMQCDLFFNIFRFISSYQQHSFHFPWHLYQSINWYLEQLEKCKRTRYNKGIHFECFISIPTNEEWLWAGTWIRDAKKLFIRKDLSTAEHLEGNWIHNEHFQCKSINNTSKDFHYSHRESMDVSTMIQAVKKHVKRIKRTAKFAITKQISMEESRGNLVNPRFSKVSPFSSQNYIFQLRNPPRYICEHQEKCGISGFEPYKIICEKLDWVYYPYPSEMQISIYECTSKESIDQMEFYFCFHRLFERLLDLDLDMGIIWRNDVSKAFPQPTASLLFLNCPNMSSHIKTQKYDFLILLDHPNNYHPKEKVPCFTLENLKVFISESLDFEIYEVEAETLTRYFEANKDFPHQYTLIDSRFHATILDKNGAPMTDGFDLLDVSNWPESIMIPKNAF